MSVGIRSGRIDLIRGVSILLVLLHHFDIAYDLRATPLAALLSPWLVHAICRNGNYGVTMFFTVSGYLIAANARHRWGRLRDIRPVAFYRRRAARILPGLVLLLAIVTTLGLAGVPAFANHSESGPPVSFLQADIAALTFRINALMGVAGWFNYCLCVLWSLSVEEVFYLGFPLLCRVLRRERLIAVAGLVLVLAGPAYRLAHQDDEARFLYANLACFDGIAIGCLAALLAARRPLPACLARAPLLVLPAMTALYLCASIGRTNVWGVSLMAAGTALLLLAAERRPAPAPVATAWLRWIGRHSYELYLFHLVVLAAMRSLAPPGRIAASLVPPWLLLYLALALAIAFAIARCWSIPAERRLRPA